MYEEKYPIKQLTYTSHFIQYEFDPHIFYVRMSLDNRCVIESLVATVMELNE